MTVPALRIGGAFGYACRLNLMATPRVTVVTNVRNGADTLPEAIDSVLAQSFTDWELVIWDNCSIDSTPEVVSRYEDPRIRYFRAETETPLSQARTAAISRAQGEWIAFLDHDDVWVPEKLEKQMALADDRDVGLIYGRTVAFSDRARTRDFDHRHEFERLPEGDIFERLFIDSCFIAMSSAMIRKSAIEDLGPPPAAIDIIPDYYFYTFVTRRHRARAVQEVVCRYRVAPGSLTGTRFRRLHEEVLWVLNALRDDLDPRLFRHRIRVHQTLIALEDMRHVRTFGSGIGRLIRHGSLPYLATRPFARTYRAVKRRLVSPYWMRTGPHRAAMPMGARRA